MTAAVIPGAGPRLCSGELSLLQEEKGVVEMCPQLTVAATSALCNCRPIHSSVSLYSLLFIQRGKRFSQSFELVLHKPKRKQRYLPDVVGDLGCIDSDWTALRDPEAAGRNTTLPWWLPRNFWESCLKILQNPLSHPLLPWLSCKTVEFQWMAWGKKRGLQCLTFA